MKWALERLGSDGWVIRSVSALYATPCFPVGAGPDYVNGALSIETDKSAPEVLQALHEVEAEAGRERVQRWGRRTLDLDLIAMGDTVQPDADTVRKWIDLPLEDQVRKAPDELILPHPRLQDRAFVLVPLMDVAPDWLHPLSGLTVREMHDALPQEDRDAVKPLVNRGNRT